jgi:hypothetical protein
MNKWSYEVEVKGLKPSGFLKFHRAMGEALAHSIMEQEIEKERLKKRMRELEYALSPKPLFIHTNEYSHVHIVQWM